MLDGYSKKTGFFFKSPTESQERVDAQVIAAVSKNINGTGCWPTTRTMTVRVYLWIGSSSRLVASADVFLSD